MYQVINNSVQKIEKFCGFLRGSRDKKKPTNQTTTTITKPWRTMSSLKSRSRFTKSLVSVPAACLADSLNFLHEIQVSRKIVFWVCLGKLPSALKQSRVLLIVSLTTLTKMVQDFPFCCMAPCLPAFHLGIFFFDILKNGVVFCQLNVL